MSGSSRKAAPADGAPASNGGRATPSRLGPPRVGLPSLHLVTDDAVLADPEFEARARDVLSAVVPGGVSGTVGAGPDPSPGGALGGVAPDPSPGSAPVFVALHLRGPRTPGRRLFELALGLLPTARAAGALLLVNDRVDVAAAAGIHGVHLGRRSLPVAEARTLLGEDAWIGASIHGEGELLDLLGECGAAGVPDFLLVGTLYETASHPGRPGAGTDRLKAVARTLQRRTVGVDSADLVGAAEEAEVPARSPMSPPSPLSPISPIPLIGIGGITPERVPGVRAAGAGGVAVLSGVWGATDPAAALARYRSAWEGS